MYKVTVMMSTFNGDKYLVEQIDSILKQRDVQVALFIRDDGSNDNTMEILKDYEKYKNVIVIHGKNVGVFRSFWDILQVVPESDYYAWSDQDDIWDLDKLIVGIEMIEKYDQALPVLYCCSHRLIDEIGNVLQGKMNLPTSVELKECFFISDSQGSTQIFNKALYRYVSGKSPNFDNIKILHDAWIHKTCIAIGGVVVYDSNEHLSYRVHSNNVVATYKYKGKQKWYHSIYRIRKDRYYSHLARKLLDTYGNYLTEDMYKYATVLAEYRTSCNYKLKLLFSSYIKTRFMAMNLGLKLLVLFNMF